MGFVSPGRPCPAVEAATVPRMYMCKTMSPDADVHVCTPRGCWMHAHICVSGHMGLGANWLTSDA